ncbi:hypothetical protein [Haloprofundus salilacus]|nr:hypothetical protein [Haloprofundus salilacus]
MAAKQPRLGVDHVTVVPTNFEVPEKFDSADEDDADDPDGESTE